ncbi:MAG: hypothetical protein Q8933_07535 [Bacteroidota bacterium]|nr:hypothetical protein [Bacteroidota bacterium]MDP4192537.1 hypothetical protein [Bacteroidota bacterium]MDP4194450.1 hypothetical protein [Bacteroidota bacterium]
MKNNRKVSEEIPGYILENIEKEKKIGAMINEAKKELKTNPIYKEFFEKYNPASIDSFIENYALKKTRYLTFGEMLKENEENALIRRQMEAEERLWEVQRKKLFNLECQWRAEMIKIPEIEITLDFEYWEKNIENCPFLNPISQDEFDLYYQYLLSDEFNDFNLDFLWMGYMEIKESIKENDNIPPWYDYFDNHMGTGSLLWLPDVRGEREEYYLKVWKDYNSPKDKASAKRKKKIKNSDPRPNLYGHELSNIEEFIKRFENNKILEYFYLYEKELNTSNNELERALNILKEADEKVPIDQSEDWRSAVIHAAKRFEQRKLASACRQAYSQYLYRIKVGIAHEVHSSDSNITWAKEWSQQVKERIIQARTLLGEPADLNI